MTSNLNPYFLILFFLGTCTQRTGQAVSEKLVQSVGKKIHNQAGHHGKSGIKLTWNDN